MRLHVIKGSQLGTFCPWAIVYCYTELKLCYFKNLKLFSNRVKELFEPIVYEKRRRVQACSQRGCGGGMYPPNLPKGPLLATKWAKNEVFIGGLRGVRFKKSIFFYPKGSFLGSCTPQIDPGYGPGKVIALLKAFSWETGLWVMLGDFKVKNAKLGRAIVFNWKFTK